MKRQPRGSWRPRSEGVLHISRSRLYRFERTARLSISKLFLYARVFVVGEPLHCVRFGVNHVFTKTGKTICICPVCVQRAGNQKGLLTMKIRLEMPRTKGLPSQGRNSGSIPDGGTTASKRFEFTPLWPDLIGISPPSGEFYRAWLDDDKSDGEFVFFVGWGVSNLTLIFQDKDGDVHICGPDEVEVC